MPRVNKKLFKRVKTSEFCFPTIFLKSKNDFFARATKFRAKAKHYWLFFLFSLKLNRNQGCASECMCVCVCGFEGWKRNCRRYWEILLSSRQYACAHFCCAYIFFFPLLEKSEQTICRACGDRVSLHLHNGSKCVSSLLPFSVFMYHKYAINHAHAWKKCAAAKGN